MKQFSVRIVFTVLIASMLLTACAGMVAQSPTPAPTAAPTGTPDPCSQELLALEVQEMHKIMREFDDAFTLAASTAREALLTQIAELQRIRREAEDFPAPVCLRPLKELQLVHMNTVIQTMLAFVSGAQEDVVSQGLNVSRQLHNQYMVEMVRLLGTPPEQENVIPFFGTPAPTGIGTPIGTISPTSTVPVVNNTGLVGVNMRSSPSLDAQSIGTLEVGQSALALGVSTDGYWVMVEVPGLPGQVGWVYGALVSLSGPVASLPVISNSP